jgi:hypothetical protein
MARSLARNTNVYATTLTLAEFIADAGGTAVNPQTAFEIKVLDGYSFSQDVATQDIGVSEADSACPGASIARGTLSFNTALNPVDVSFSTYVRPWLNSVDVTGGANAFADAVERVLWASAMGTAASWTEVTVTSAPAAGEVISAQDASSIDFGLGKSNANELLKLTLFFVLDNTTYAIEDFSVNTAEVDFSIDGIATINWSGNGSLVKENPVVHELLKTGGTWEVQPGVKYQAVPNTTPTSFLRNKLSTLELSNNQVDTPADTDVQSGAPTGKVITLVGTITSLIYAGGRVENVTRSEWATIVSNTTGAITVSPGDSLTNWVDTDALNIYTLDQHAGIVYCVPITGATLTLENNYSYLTPEELATVNIPLAGFAGSRVSSGSFTAYLNTGAMGTGGLLADLLGKIQDSVTTDYALTFHMGNAAGNTPRVDFDIPHAQISVPSTNVEDIISTEISFTAKPWDTVNDAASFEDTNEMTVSYVIA